MSFRRFENSRNVEVPAGTGTNRFWHHEHVFFRPRSRATNTEHGVMDKTKPHGLFFKIIFFQNCPILDSNPLPSQATLIPQKECESIETVLSLTLKDRRNPCQESAIWLECLKFSSGDNYGLGWGPPLSTITCHAHGSSGSRTTVSSFIPLPLSF
jgi:hypothetical protein